MTPASARDAAQVRGRRARGRVRLVWSNDAVAAPSRRSEPRAPVLLTGDAPDAEVTGAAVSRWPGWLRVLVIAGLSLASWAAIIFAGLQLLR